MKPRFIFFFIFFTLFLLFYPGDSFFFNIFAYNRTLFHSITKHLQISLHDAPVRKTTVDPLVTAEGVYIVDIPSFSAVLEKNSQQSFLPASTTKIITALVATDLYKPDDIITIKNVLQDGQVMGLIAGEKITVENLLYGALVHSGNDAAYALADNHGLDDFVRLMNKKTKQLGMLHSTFRNPAGLDDSVQMTTPFDLALAARALLRNPLLKKIVATKEITIADVDFKIFHRLSNVNKLLGEVQGVGGLKTGYTEQAGENLVSFYKKNGHEFIIVILKSEDRFADTRSVITWIDQNVEYQSLSVN